MGAVAVVAVGLVLSTEESTPPDTIPDEGPAQDFVLDNVRSGQAPVAFADYRGRPVVLNFFASWCAPCRVEMPAFEAVHRRLGDKVAFVGVAQQDTRSDALGLVEQAGATYPAAVDPSGGVAAGYGFLAMPTTLFISGTGRVLERHSGPLRQQDLEATIDRLFGS